MNEFRYHQRYYVSVQKDWPPNSWLIHQILAEENEDCSIFEKAAVDIDIYACVIVCGVRDVNGAGCDVIGVKCCTIVVCFSRQVLDMRE